MSAKKKFSPEAVEELRANPYTERVTAERISFTLAVKEEFWRLSVEGCIGNMAFRRLGYDPEVLGFERVHNITKRIRRAARTPGGLQGKAAAWRAGLGAVTMERTSFRFGAIRAALAEEGSILTVTELAISPACPDPDTTAG